MLARVPDRSEFSYSVVIPVYNSQDIVGSTVEQVAEIFETAGLRYQVEETRSRSAKFDLLFRLAEPTTPGGRPGGLEGAVEYSTDLFDRSTVEDLVTRFVRLLESLANTHERPL